MKLPRRQFLHLAAGAAALPAISRFAWAQTYPTRPVRIISGFPPGGVNDIASRIVAIQLCSAYVPSECPSRRPETKKRYTRDIRTIFPLEDSCQPD